MPMLVAVEPACIFGTRNIGVVFGGGGACVGIGGGGACIGGAQDSSVRIEVLGTHLQVSGQWVWR